MSYLGNRFHPNTTNRSQNVYTDGGPSRIDHMNPLSNRVIFHLEPVPALPQAGNISRFIQQPTRQQPSEQSQSSHQAIQSQSSRPSQYQRRCSVCSCDKNVSISPNHGIPFCANCKKFIQKINSRTSTIPAECVTGHNNCIITEDSRNNCRYCRLQKYIELTTQPPRVNISNQSRKTNPRGSLTSGPTIAKKAKRANHDNLSVIESIRGKCCICGSHLRVENRLNVLCCQACYKFAHVIGEGKAKCPTECISGHNNCIIDFKSRGQCRYCRLHKCLLLGMNLNLPNQLLDSNQQLAPKARQVPVPQNSTQHPVGSCPVCGSEQSMTIYNYNSACNNCKKFINKIKIGRSTVPIKCISGQSNCIIDEKLKSYCRFCRLQKCLSIGMSIQLPARGGQIVQPARKPKVYLKGKVCAVCDSPHRVENCFKIPCCQACQKFLYKIKTDRRNAPIKCLTGRNDCVINESTRTNCRYCRFQKFLAVYARTNPSQNCPLGNVFQTQPVGGALN